MTSERRANKRFLLHSWVQITGVDESGLQFAERSRLEDIGDSGCRLSILGAVHQGSVLAIKPLGAEGQDLQDEFSRLFVVIWAKRKGNRLTVGARSLRQHEFSDVGIHGAPSGSDFSEK